MVEKNYVEVDSLIKFFQKQIEVHCRSFKFAYALSCTLRNMQKALKNASAILEELLKKDSGLYEQISEYEKKAAELASQDIDNKQKALEELNEQYKEAVAKRQEIMATPINFDVHKVRFSTLPDQIEEAADAKALLYVLNELGMVEQ